jgi:hypothetical protein
MDVLLSFWHFLLIIQLGMTNELRLSSPELGREHRDLTSITPVLSAPLRTTPHHSGLSPGRSLDATLMACDILRKLKIP